MEFFEKNNVYVFLQDLNRKKSNMEFIYVSGGSWFEKEGDRGKRHLMEHCIVSRTKDKNFQELKDYIFRENLDLNAYTGILSMGLELSGHYSDFQKMTDLLLELFIDPTFVQEDLDREKEIVLREISERRGGPSYRLHYDVMRRIYTLDSYANHEILGDSEAVAKTTLEDFNRLHKQSLAESNLILTFSGGGLDKKYIEGKISNSVEKSQNFPIIKEKETKLEVNYKLKNDFLDFDFLKIRHPLAHEHIDLTLYIPFDVTFEKRPSLLVFEHLFTRYGGVIYDRLRDDLGLVYAFYADFRKENGTLTISLACEQKHVKTIIKEIEDCLSSFDNYFNTQKFKEFRDILRKKIEIAEDTMGSSIKFMYKSLKSYGQVETYQDYSKRIASVTEEDLKSVYREIENNLDKKRIVAVSKNPQVKKI
jgi:predicted Zn-dependent peptidase